MIDPAAHIHTVEDARRLARKRLPWMVFDYIDGAAGSEHGVIQNRAALDAYKLRLRILRDVSTRSLATTIFGVDAQRPFGISPMAMCNLSAQGADLMLARLAARYSIPHGVSTVASTPMETLHEESQGNAWFQLYFSGDGTESFKLVERAQSAGYKTLILTVDVPELGRRPREMRQGFKLPFKMGARQFIDFALHPRWSLETLFGEIPEVANFRMDGFAFERTDTRAKADWSTLKRLRELWKGNLVVKGVLDVDDALELQRAGVDAIQVSSHGGRQLDSCQVPFLALSEIRQAVGRDFPLFYDSGIRSGEDILKALEAGADFIFLGRPLQFAMAAGKEAGLNRLWEVLSDELSNAMALTGQTTLPSRR